MTDEQIDLLIAYIDAKIDEHACKNSSDGGLIEHIEARKLEEKLRAALGEA